MGKCLIPFCTEFESSWMEIKKYGKHIQLNMTNLGPFFQCHIDVCLHLFHKTSKKNKKWLSLPNSLFYWPCQNKPCIYNGFALEYHIPNLHNEKIHWKLLEWILLRFEALNSHIDGISLIIIAQFGYNKNKFNINEDTFYYV